MKHTLISIFLIVLASPAISQWHLAGNGDINNPGLDVAFGIHDSTIFRADSRGVWRHVDTGLHPWIESDAGIDFTQGNITSFASLGRYFFAATTHSDGVNGPAFISTNGGTSWGNGTTAGPVASNGAYLFGTYGGPDQIVRSTDSGKDWNVVYNLSVATFSVLGACILASNSNGIYRSTDSGTNWNEIPSPPSGLRLSAFATIDTEMFAGKYGVYFSSDSGKDWALLGLKSRTVNALASYEKYLFAGTDTGVFMSSDRGITWRNVSDSLDARPGHFPDVTILAVLDTFLYAEVDAGTDPSGTYGYPAMRSIPEMIADTEKAAVAQVPAMDSIEIYPNPATGTVTIQNGGPIFSISVTNLLGTEVISIPKLDQAAIMLDLSKEQAGTYFISVQTGKGNSLHKIVKEN